TITLIVLALQTVLCAHQLSDLRIKNSFNHPIWVVINHQEPIKVFSHATIEDLVAGRHFIQVIKKIHPHHIKKIIYEGTIDIPFQSIVKTEISPYYGFRIKNVVPKHIYTSSCNPTVFYPGNGVCFNQSPVYYQNNINMISDYEFDALLRVIEKSSFDETKYKIARTAIENSWISSIQLAIITEKMSFESTRLKLAKLGYNRLYDRENAYVVFDSFEFDSSVQEFERYIRINS
ncbi:MAG TPA: DUF4476 domain-containing protein, partial [Bacteroidia bacterium]|nr:DUF4476 domain-containing protein [Bacteroidia bacterium]